MEEILAIILIIVLFSVPFFGITDKKTGITSSITRDDYYQKTGNPVERKSKNLPNQLH